MIASISPLRSVIKYQLTAVVTLLLVFNLILVFVYRHGVAVQQADQDALASLLNLQHSVTSLAFVSLSPTLPSPLAAGQSLSQWDGRARQTAQQLSLYQNRLAGSLKNAYDNELLSFNKSLELVEEAVQEVLKLAFRSSEEGMRGQLPLAAQADRERVALLLGQIEKEVGHIKDEMAARSRSQQRWVNDMESLSLLVILTGSILLFFFVLPASWRAVEELSHKKHTSPAFQLRASESSSQGGSRLEQREEAHQTGNRDGRHRGLSGKEEAAKAQPYLAAATHLGKEQQKQSVSILVVDDSEMNRIIVSQFLKSANHCVSFAENGEEAVQKHKESVFDVIFMDIQMPVMDGWEATRLIREHESSAELKPCRIIALTALGRDADVLRSREAGCDHHFVKPVKKAMLQAYISSYSQDSRT